MLSRLDSLPSGGSGSRVDTVVVSAGDSIVMLLVERGRNTWDIVVVADVETESGRFNAAVAPNKESTEDWLREDVENTVEDSLGVGSDNVTTLAKTPSNRIEKP